MTTWEKSNQSPPENGLVCYPPPPPREPSMTVSPHPQGKMPKSDGIPAPPPPPPPWGETQGCVFLLGKGGGGQLGCDAWQAAGTSFVERSAYTGQGGAPAGAVGRMRACDQAWGQGQAGRVV